MLNKKTKTFEDFQYENNEIENSKKIESRNNSFASHRLYLSIPPSDALRNEGRFILAFALISWVLASGLKIKEVTILNLKVEAGEPLIFFSLFLVSTYLLLSFSFRIFGEFTEWFLQFKETERVQTPLITYSILKVFIDLIAPIYLIIKSTNAIYHVYLNLPK